MPKNKKYNIGHVSKEGDYLFVNIYTCNGRCCETKGKHKINPEQDKCCESIKLLLDEESQNKVDYQQIIYFSILESVDHPINNWIGLYAKFQGYVKD